MTKAAKLAAKAGVKAVVMTHLGPTVTPNDDYQRYIDEAKRYFSGQIVLAKDLMQFDVPTRPIARQATIFAREREGMTA